MANHPHPWWYNNSEIGLFLTVAFLYNLKRVFNGWFTSLNPNTEEQKKPNHMYYFEGRDYSMEPSAADQKSFQRLRQEEEQLAGPPGDEAGGGPSLRHKAGVTRSLALPPCGGLVWIGWFCGGGKHDG